MENKTKGNVQQKQSEQIAEKEKKLKTPIKIDFPMPYVYPE